jgi:phage/plasmid-like protein (TIGR03299 family)
MAHELAEKENGEMAMAYIGAEPWHGLGQKLRPNASIKTWAKASGMDMPLLETPVKLEGGIVVADKKAIYRGDTKEGLAVVGNNYKLIQPIEVLEFFKRYVGDHASLETAGMLFGGRSYWAMARLEGEIDVAGDITHPYLLLNSSCDGSTSTTARLTSVRVVCNNTLSMAERGKADVKLRHNQVFCAQSVAGELEESYASLKAHATMLKALAKVKVGETFATALLKQLLDGRDLVAEQDAKLSRGATRILELFNGEGMGADATSSKGTAYGLLQATTQYFDHEYGRSQEGRLNDAWFGYTSGVKKKFAQGLVDTVAA